jgi:leader peptidase (prepilin peptidase) / N-methyltransferase
MELYGLYLWYAWSFAIGGVVGSFLNVVIVRLPLGESLVHPRSHCPHCGHPIRGHDNVPLVSYVVLRGHCRDCGASISARYPLVELITACLSLALFHRFGLGPEYAVFFIFCCSMIVVFWIDVDYMIIPDAISINGMVIGLLAAVMGWLPEMGWKSSLAGLVLGGAVLYLPAALYEKVRGVEGLGGGDIKLLAMMGAFLGPYGVIFVLFFGSLVGTLFALLGMVFKAVGSSSPIPFGPFLTTAAVTYLFVGETVVERFQALPLSLPF